MGLDLGQRDDRHVESEEEPAREEGEHQGSEYGEVLEG